MSYQPNSYPNQGFGTPRPQVWPSPVFPQADIPALIQNPCDPEQIFLNTAKRNAQWIYLASSPYPAALSNADSVTNLSITPPLDEGNSGDAELVYLMSTSTDRFGIQLSDTWTNRKYSNGFVANNLVFGTPTAPFVLYESWFLPATTSLTAIVQNLGSGSNDVRIVAAGRRFTGSCGPKALLQRPFINRKTHPYWLTFDNGPEVTLAASTTTSYTMTVPSSADFLCWAVMDDSTVTAEDAVTVRILEGTSGRILMNQALSLRQFVAAPTLSVSGFPGNTLRAAGFPFTMMFTHLFPRNTQVIIEATNSAVSAQTLRIAFHGQLIYNTPCDPTYPNPENTRMLQQPFMPMPAPPNWIPCGMPTGAPMQAPQQMPPQMMQPAPAPMPQPAPQYAPIQHIQYQKDREYTNNPAWGGHGVNKPVNQQYPY